MFVRTPGTCCRNPTIPLLPEGMSASASPCSDVAVVACVTSTRGDCPDTVMVSLTVPIFITSFSVAVNPDVSRMPSRRTVWKPPSSNCSVKVPIGSGDNR